MPKLQPGATGHAEMVVGTNDTAPRVGSGVIPVLATPVMINLMEAAALDAVEQLLQDGHQSLGTHLDVSHISATPIGMKVVANAKLSSVSGRNLTFDVSAEDNNGLIGEGIHSRVIVNVAKFEKRLKEKAGKV